MFSLRSISVFQNRVERRGLLTAVALAAGSVALADYYPAGYLVDTVGNLPVLGPLVRMCTHHARDGDRAVAELLVDESEATASGEGDDPVIVPEVQEALDLPIDPINRGRRRRAHHRLAREIAAHARAVVRPKSPPTEAEVESMHRLVVSALRGPTYKDLRTVDKAAIITTAPLYFSTPSLPELETRAALESETVAEWNSVPNRSHNGRVLQDAFRGGAPLLLQAANAPADTGVMAAIRSLTRGDGSQARFELGWDRRRGTAAGSSGR
jgi:hypothetical protein